MLKNYLKVTIRNLIKNKTYSLITIIGLAIGLSYCLLTFLYLHSEWTYDQFHSKHKRTFRIYSKVSIKKQQIEREQSFVPTAMGPALKENIPEIENFVRLTSTRGQSWEDQYPYFKIEDKTFREKYLLTDPSFFTIFSFPLQDGDVNQVFRDIHSIVISQKIAKKYFNELNPIGKNISICSVCSHEWQDYKVTGIIRDFPENSSIQADILLPYENMQFFYHDNPDWQDFKCNTYITLLENANLPKVEEKILSVVQKHVSDRKNPEVDVSIKLQPLKDLHSNTKIENWVLHGLTPPVSPLYSYVLTCMGLVILIIACINFINLSLGRISTRIKEIGIRKIVGAGPTGIMKQFLFESTIITLCALSISFLFTEFILPFFNNFTNKSLSFNLSSFTTVLFMTGFVFTIGILAGSYPAILLSKYHPVESLKFLFKIGGKNKLRHSLMVVQFCFCILLILVSLIMTRQINHVRSTQALGFNKENLVVINTEEMPEINRDGSLNFNKKILADKLKQHANILNVATTRYCHESWQIPVAVSHPEIGEFKVRKMSVDYDFTNTFQLQLVEGGTFSEKIDNLNTGSIIVTESFVEKMKWHHPVGKTFAFDKENWRGLSNTKGVATVIGVVKDFHFLSLKDEIYPTVLLLNHSIGSESRLCIAKIASYDIPGTMKYIEKVWKEVNPDLTFRYSFFDQDIEYYYQNDFHWLRLISFTSFFAIFIACMGLFGIISIVVNQRIKEIGIRKVCGASIASLWALLSINYVKLVLGANLIAWPLAYLVMNKWLQNFAYRIEISWWMFALAGGLALVIALATVSWQAVRAATANPVEALRYE